MTEQPKKPAGAPARGASRGGRRTLDGYSGDSHAPASRPLVDADEYLAQTEGTDGSDAAPADAGGDQTDAAAVEGAPYGYADQGQQQAAAPGPYAADRYTAYEGGGAYEEQPPARQAAVQRRAPAPAQRPAAPTPQYPAVREMPWREVPGRGRPHHIPHPADALDRRKVDRTPLHLSVPSVLELEERLRDYVHFNRVDVPGDVLGVALDEWLAARGY